MCLRDRRANNRVLVPRARAKKYISPYDFPDSERLLPVAFDHSLIMAADSDYEITEPSITTEAIVDLDDEHFRPENVAIVTGAGSGIGKATAICLAANDLTVLATGLDDLDSTVDRAEELEVPGRIEPFDADLTDDTELEAVVEEAASLGTVTYLANIAGLQHVESIDEFPMDRYDLIQDVMTRAPFYLAKLCLPEMRDRGDDVGVIGNMCSIHGHVATRDKAPYIMSKFALRGLTQAIAAEGEGSIRSFSISTAYVKTPLVTKQIPKTAEERGISERAVVEDVMLGTSRTKEMMEPIDVGNLFTYGFSSHSRHLNGNDLLYDGGAVNTYI